MSKAIILNKSTGQDKDMEDFYKHPLNIHLSKKRGN